MILKDPIVNPYFVMALGNDLESQEWQEHYAILENFWLMLMTGEKAYDRDAFTPHTYIGELDRETFEQWLALFYTVLQKYYTSELVAKFHKRAEVLSRKFMQWLDIA